MFAYGMPNDMNKKKNNIYLHVLEPKNINPPVGIVHESQTQ
jgi:hypothetical protein